MPDQLPPPKPTPPAADPTRITVHMGNKRYAIDITALELRAKLAEVIPITEAHDKRANTEGRATQFPSKPESS